MLRVVIELHPFGDASRSKVINEIFIANMGDSLNQDEEGTWCKYNAWRTKPTRETIDTPDAQVDHRREDGAEELLRKVLNELD